MKIGHICLSLGLGGAEKLLVDNLPFYRKLGHDISLIQLSSKLEEKKYIEQIKSNGINVITLSGGKFINPMYLFKLKNLLANEKFDIVHVHLFPNLYYLSILKMLRFYDGVVVFTEHNTKNGRSHIKLFNLIEPYIYKYYNSIIAISENVKLYLENLLPNLKNKITLINNGVNVTKYRDALSYNRDIFLNEDKQSKDNILLLMVSRFSEPKDQLTLINAMNFLDDRFVLLLVGEGEKMEECKRVASSFGSRVRFLGFRNDVPELMKTVDVNILSSGYEGFSGVALESLASGNPFLGSNVPGINDLVPNSDFLFNFGEAEEIAEKIIRISEDKIFREKMVNEAFQHVNQFDVKVMINKHLELYSQLIKNKSKK